MKTRFALMLMALLPILAACKAQDGTTNTTAPTEPAAPTSTPAAETTPAPTEAAPAASGETAAAETAAAEATTPAPAPASSRPTGPEPVEGTDYLVIADGKPFQPATGKIEVAEVFGFVCPACAAFQPLIGPWKAGLPSDVNFVYIPAMFGGTWDDYAKAFYAAQSLGLEDKTHEALYRAIHVDQSLKGERGRDSVQDIAAFYAKHGADAKQFEAAMSSFAVSAKTSAAKQFALRSKIQSTPSVIVNGRYLVKGKSFPDMLRIADHLIARERAAKGN
ncbi:thiol:disulfide interchange protein DsbA/DsbL [Stenotrophomonas sp. AB1(2024)]|uniref:thiol:disulfide interchange protein DsbA/DsbL n=1 Tax=Stenotrophomonas sp. AB1(2024) TaxID=3132215 RepID=UPI0030988BCB